MKNNALMWIVIGMFLPISTSMAQQQVLRLGVGTENGAYSEFGIMLSEVVAGSGANDFSIDVVLTDGSVDSIHKLRDNDLDLAIVQNDIAYYMYEGSRGYQSFTGFRSGVPLFEEYLQVLVRKDSSVRSLGELQHLTVSLGPQGSGSYHNAVDLMTEAGLRPGVDFAAVYLDTSNAIAKLRTGEVDAVISTGAVFQASESEDSTKVRAVSLSREIVGAMTLRSPYYVAVSPMLEVDGVSAEISTVSVLSFLVFSDSVSEIHASRIVSMFEEHSNRFNAVAGGHLKFAAIEDTDIRKPVPLHAGTYSYLLERGYVSRNTDQYWAFAIGLLLVAAVIYAQTRCNAYDRLGNVRSASGAWTYRILLWLSRFNTLIVVMVIFVFVLLALVESIQYFEGEYARQHNIRNQFADIGFWDAVLWMFMFMGSGHTADIFPLSGPGKVLATALPFLGIGSVLGFALLGLDETRARIAARKRGRLATKVKNHVLVCGWNEKAKGIVYGLTSDDVPRKKHAVVVAEIDGDMPLENHDFDPRFVTYQRGDSADHDVLARANVGHADAAVVVAGVKKRAGRNVRSILSVMALREAYAKANPQSGNEDSGLFIAAELLFDENRPLFHACGAGAVVTAEVVANRIVAQCCVNDYIVDFLLDALTYDDASELYSTRIGRIGRPTRGLLYFFDRILGPFRHTSGTAPLVGKTLSQARHLLAQHGINVVGSAESRRHTEVLIDDKFDNKHYLFPNDDDNAEVELSEDQVLLFFADDHSNIHLAARKAAKSDLNTQVSLNNRNGDMITPVARKVLLVGDWERCRSVREILGCVPWCAVTILTESVPKHSEIEENVVVGDLANISVWSKAGLAEVDQVTVLTQSGEQANAGQSIDDNGEIDARAIFTARFAQSFHKKLSPDSETTYRKPTIAAEMLGSKSRPLFADAGVDVIVPSSLLVERMLTKLVYSKGSVCRFLMALLAFDDNRHLLTVTLSSEKHASLIGRTFAELIGDFPPNAQILGLLPGNSSDRENFVNPVPDFDFHFLTSPEIGYRKRYISKDGDKLIVIIDHTVKKQ